MEVLVRLIACGSVGAGKSSLIRQLLDQSSCFVAAGRRTFGATEIAADVHARQMFGAASAADLAIVVHDVRKPLFRQGRHEIYLSKLLGIPRVVAAINKMDLVAYSPEVFARVEAEYREFAGRIGLPPIECIPVTATAGENIGSRLPAMSWYAGPSLLEHLAGIQVVDESVRPFRLPVENVISPGQPTRRFEGTIASGRVAPGDAVRVLPSGRQIRVAQVLVETRGVEVAKAGQSVIVALDQDVDVQCGDVLAAADHAPMVADEFEATVIWMHDEPMLPGRSYLITLAGQTTPATIAPLKYRFDIDTLEHVPGRSLALNEIGVCGLALRQSVVFEPYAESRRLGGFLVVDRLTGGQVGAGLLHFALRRSQNVHWQALDINKAARAQQNRQRPCVVWFTGLSGAGKSTIANLLEKRLHALGCRTYLLDGDNVRHGLNRDLGFTAADRVENIRRVAEVSRLMVDAGLIVLVSFISPFRAERRMARDLVEGGEFCEVFVDAPLALAESRDPKGLYRKARRGELKNFTGVDSPYESPEHPELRIDTARVLPEEAVEIILERLRCDRIVPDA
jgi:bifunctional enzyme CysN/CysC